MFVHYRLFFLIQCRYATLCIRENPDCLFIATDAAGHLLANLEQCSDYQCTTSFLLNVNYYYQGHRSPAPYKLFIGDAGAGCTISSLCASTEKEPIVVGKPSSFIMDILVERYVTCITILRFPYVLHKCFNRIFSLNNCNIFRFKKHVADFKLTPQKCAWWVIDWTPIYYLVKMLVAKLFLFFQVFFYLQKFNQFYSFEQMREQNFTANRTIL